MTKRWAPGCTCCGCVLTDDDFELGSIDTQKWSEENGTWTVSCTTSCVLSGSASHSLIKTVATVDGHQRIWADVTSANRARLILHYQDEDNYVCLELYSLFQTADIIERSGGTDTIRASLGLASPVTQGWTFCSNDTCYSAFSDDGARLLTWNHSGVASGATSGALGSAPGTTSAAFEAAQFYEPDTGEDCDECLCGCNGCASHAANLPETLTADITGCWDSGSCPNLTVDASYGLTKTDECEYKYEVSSSTNIVWKITVDLSVSPPTMRVDFNDEGTDDSASLTLNAATIADCSEGNFSGTFGAITGVCIDGLACAAVTG